MAHHLKIPHVGGNLNRFFALHDNKCKCTLQSHAVLKACKKALSSLWMEQEGYKRHEKALQVHKYQDICKTAVATAPGKNVWCTLNLGIMSRSLACLEKIASRELGLVWQSVLMCFVGVRLFQFLCSSSNLYQHNAVHCRQTVDMADMLAAVLDITIILQDI